MAVPSQSFRLDHSDGVKSDNESIGKFKGDNISNSKDCFAIPLDAFLPAKI